MSSIKAPDTYRQFDSTPPLNRAGNDYINSEGVRISCPLYIDPPSTSIRKQWLNAVRDIASQPHEQSQPNTMSGISVVAYGNRQPEVETFIGMDLDKLRASLFTRGGIQPELVFKLQALTGIIAVTEKDLDTAFNARKKLAKDLIKSLKFDKD